ncbi:MAG: MBL fold metallo-hydrolase [Pseudomonadota bacterium]
MPENQNSNNGRTNAILRARILGCGSSGGVPRLGGKGGSGDWGVCDPNEPKNRRTRCSLLVERFNINDEGSFLDDTPTRLLIDTSPDMRAQLLNARVGTVDAVLMTHDHADQTHGIDDLRVLALQNKARVPVYIDPHTAGAILERFGYCFVQPEGSWYPPILEQRPIPNYGDVFEIAGEAGPIPVVAFWQGHGGVDSLGFRCGDIAYSSDVKEISDESFEVLKGVKVWIVDALQMKPHGSHAHLDLTLEWIDRVQPERAILTNLHISMDYQTLCDHLPEYIRPAYDGMTIDVII